MSTVIRVLVVVAVLMASFPRLTCACPEDRPTVASSAGCACEHTDDAACCCEHASPDQSDSQDAAGPLACEGGKSKLTESVSVLHHEATHELLVLALAGLGHAAPGLLEDAPAARAEPVTARVPLPPARSTTALRF